MPERGWYPDPDQPGRERWYTGTEWSRASHKAAGRVSVLPSAWVRLFWPGTNRWARVSDIALGVALAPIAVMLVLSYADPTSNYVLIARLSVVVIAIAAVSIALGAIGLAASPKHGAVGLAACSVVGGASLVVLAVVLQSASTYLAAL